MMSWSLAIQHGDLAWGSQGLATTQDHPKLVQDLTCAILEPLGTDPLHPTFGTTIDGGTLPDGTHSDGVIGELNDAHAAAFVQAEVRRVAAQQQAAQQARYQADVNTYGRSTLSADEVLLSVTNVEIQAAQNQMLVKATLQTGIGSLPFIAPISPVG